jgi:ribosomal protein S18 acetylase RimI-like enzyme
MDHNHPLCCLIALDASGTAQGFTLYLPIAFTWSKSDVCYLEDIYVRPESRGQGHARAMIAHLEDIGRKRGWYKIFWMTEADNHAAQRLYERVASRMDYLRYDIILARG